MLFLIILVASRNISIFTNISQIFNTIEMTTNISAGSPLITINILCSDVGVKCFTPILYNNNNREL